MYLRYVVGDVYVGAVRPQPAHKILSARRRCEKMEGAIEMRTCGAFYAGKRKQGFFTLKEYGARMMKGQRDVRWLDGSTQCLKRLKIDGLLWVVRY